MAVVEAGDEPGLAVAEQTRTTLEQRAVRSDERGNDEVPGAGDTPGERMQLARNDLDVGVQQAEQVAGRLGIETIRADRGGQPFETDTISVPLPKVTSTMLIRGSAPAANEATGNGGVGGRLPLALGAFDAVEPLVERLDPCLETTERSEHLVGELTSLTLRELDRLEPHLFLGRFELRVEVPAWPIDDPAHSVGPTSHGSCLPVRRAGGRGEGAQEADVRAAEVGARRLVGDAAVRPLDASPTLGRVVVDGPHRIGQRIDPDRGPRRPGG